MKPQSKEWLQACQKYNALIGNEMKRYTEIKNPSWEDYIEHGKIIDALHEEFMNALHNN